MKTSLTDSAILATAIINDAPHIMRLDQQPLAVRKMASECAKRGIHVVSVRWDTGEFAIMPCPIGSIWPSPTMIVTAYRGCQAFKKQASPDTS